MNFTEVAVTNYPANGVESTITKEDLDANLDPKPAKKPAAPAPAATPATQAVK